MLTRMIRGLTTAAPETVHNPNDCALKRVTLRVTNGVYSHGGHFSNFEGLRQYQYKEKFKPVWDARYLATPGGLSVPLVLTHLASLASGGVSGVFHRLQTDDPEGTRPGSETCRNAPLRVHSNDRPIFGE